ncbi:MAG: GNAT family N-acetyltransferase [SAR202 cluster bacterium]|nr:GNAT family N-acetyltransferase [SAR202 cluster bacterium]
MLPRTREATQADNSSLLALANICSFYGRVSQHVDRSPDFFRLSSLQGEPWSVGVVDGPSGAIIGCVAVAERKCYVNGIPRNTAYVTDLRVHPAHRRTGAADSLVRYAMRRCREMAGYDAPVLCVIAPNNKPLGNLTFLKQFAEIITYSVIPLGRHYKTPKAGLAVSPAGPNDVEEMASLWCRLAPQRQFTPEFSTESLIRWIEKAPGLSISSYWLARQSDGELAGFMGVWDQTLHKRSVVQHYTTSSKLFRVGFDVIAPLLGAGRLPGVGGVLKHLTAVHLCASEDDPLVLRSLITRAIREISGKGHSFFTIGLDATDPLSTALKGMLSVKTRTLACVGTSDGKYSGPPLGDRPLYFEIALM